MFRNMSVGRKIMCGFVSVLVLLAIVAGIAWWALSNAAGGLTEYRAMARGTNSAGRVQANMLMVRMNVKDFLISHDAKELQEFQDYCKKTAELLEQARQEIQDPEQLAKLASAAENLQAYQAGFGELTGVVSKADALVSQTLDVQGPVMEKALTRLLEDTKGQGTAEAALCVSSALRQVLLARLYANKFLANHDTKAAERVSAELAGAQQNLTQLQKMEQFAQDQQVVSKVQEALGEYSKTFAQIVDLTNRQDQVVKGTLDRVGPLVAASIEDIKMAIMKTQDELGPRLVAANNQAVAVMLAISGIALAMGLVLSILISRGITRALNKVIEGLKLGAEQTASASNQVAQSSQQMAEGASQQASSLEEVSSSLEEMASMTRQNADNAGQANSMASQAAAAAEQGNAAMARMAEAINRIKTSSDQTAKIIKTIDEIAFQTNLLALNAAVEAARAGEAGKGFAVVAEEVRNLAQRSAEAAKNTSSLIEESQKNAENGVQVTDEVAKILSQIVTDVQKVNQLIGEVSTASKEQTQGIEQINTAVAQMDKVTQSNAANAEESASASEELSAQARELNEMVNALVAIVGGAGTARSAGQPQAGQPKAKPDRLDHALHEAWQTKSSQPTKKAAPAATTAKAASRPAKPQEVIPLDDAELKQF